VDQENPSESREPNSKMTTWIHWSWGTPPPHFCLFFKIFPNERRY
jgi:hypothetical protein